VPAAYKNELRVLLVRPGECFQKYLQIADVCPLISSGPLNSMIVDLNKPYIIRNGRELGDLEYLPTKIQYTEYLQNTDVCTSHFFGPFKQHDSRFK